MVFFPETTEKSSFPSYIQIKLFNSMSYFLAVCAYIFIGEKLPIWFNLFMRKYVYLTGTICVTNFYSLSRPSPRPPPRYLYHAQDRLCEKNLKIVLKNFDPSRRNLNLIGMELVCDKIIPLICIQLYCFKNHSGLLEYKNCNPHGLLLVATIPLEILFIVNKNYFSIKWSKLSYWWCKHRI